MWFSVVCTLIDNDIRHHSGQNVVDSQDAASISWDIPRVTFFSWYTHKPLGECVYQENTSDKWNIPRYPTRERCITILYHAIEDTVANLGRAASDGKVGCNTAEFTRISCILIGCIFYDMV